METHLPPYLKSYFWDVDFDALILEKAPVFILKRLIDRGDTQAWGWTKENFTLDQIKELIITTKDISRKSANFWAKILDIPEKLVPCLQKPYSRIPFGLSG